jgi:subtilisin family serine protease
LALTGTTFFRWRIPDRRSVRAVIRALEADRLVASAQPNYLYRMQQSAAGGDGGAQYALAKLHLLQAHTLATGKNVRVAVIDSAVDLQSAELAGSIAGTFDTLKSPRKAHAHGTSIATLIAGHGQLTGAAPGAKILAVRAFDPDAHGAQGSTVNIIKGLDWAVANRARIINMSFAGPADPLLERALEAAHKKGITLIAAAGNAGAKSPPLYPAAYSPVIAVSATDADDHLLEQSNRGGQIALAAPGKDILVALPGGGVEVSSGTSYSAAEVSGVAALLIQRDGKLTPDKLRRLLEKSAKDLGPSGRDHMFGYGLVDAAGALARAGAPVTAELPTASVPLPLRRVSTDAP